LVFNVVPSELDDLYWTRTHYDFTVKLKLYSSDVQMRFCQDYQTLGNIISGIFGSETEKGQQKDNKIDYTNPVINSPEQLSAFLANLRKK